MQYKIISFYSEPEPNSTYYTCHAKKFIEACERLNLDYHVEKLEGKGDYFKNCKMKPSFIQSCIDKFNTPVLWIDIDSDIRSVPIIDTSLDFAAVKKIKCIRPIYAHCLFFNTTQNGLRLLKTWKDLCENDGGGTTGDHSILIALLEKFTDINFNYIEDFTKFNLAPKSEIKSKVYVDPRAARRRR